MEALLRKPAAGRLASRVLGGSFGALVVYFVFYGSTSLAALRRLLRTASSCWAQVLRPGSAGFRALLEARRRGFAPAAPTIVADPAAAAGPERCTISGSVAAIRESVLLVTEVSLAGDVLETMPVRILRPASAASPAPAVVLLHSTGASMEQMLETEAAAGGLSPAASFLERGFVVAVADLRYHGDRYAVLSLDGPSKKRAYEAALAAAVESRWADVLEALAPRTLSSRCLRLLLELQRVLPVFGGAVRRLTPRGGAAEMPFIYDSVFDLMRLGEYLRSREDIVDGGAIGAAGKSLGGMHALLWAFADESVKAAAPLIGTQDFAYAVAERKFMPRVRSIALPFEYARAALGKEEVDAEVVDLVWHAMNPGITAHYDLAPVLAGIYPRQVMVLNGAEDGRCPREGVERAARRAEAAVESGRGWVTLDFEPGVGHRTTPRMWEKALRFLADQLLTRDAPPRNSRL